MRRAAGPIIAAFLLLLLIYIGCYLALVLPPDPFAGGSHRMRMRANSYHYRYCSSPFWDSAAKSFFWPLKAIDERVRRKPDWRDAA